MQNHDPMNEPRQGRTPDRGFTLVEVLIVTLLIGVVMTTMVAVVSVILRTTPPTDIRASDARSLQGLVTWLPQDVDATPPGGFDNVDWPCAGSTPAGQKILTMNWQETTDITHEFATSYRYEQVGSEWRIARYACDDVATPGTMSTADRINLTSAVGLSPPSVVLCKAAVDPLGLCPAVVSNPLTEDVVSLKLEVELDGGNTSTIDAAPKNPDSNLSDDPSAPIPNTWPVALPTLYPLNLLPGETGDVTVAVTDDDGDPVSVAIDTSVPIPTGLTVWTVSPLTVFATADSGLGAGTVDIPLIISDNHAGWDSAVLEVTIVTPSNAGPTIASPNYDLYIAPGETLVLPLAVTHGLSDPDGDPMNGVIASEPGSWSGVASVVSIDGFPYVTVPAPTTETPGTTLPGWLRATVYDDDGAWVDVDIKVHIVLPTGNASPLLVNSDVGTNVLAGDSVSVDLATLSPGHEATDPDGDPIWVELASAPAGISVATDGATGLTITADSSLVSGTVHTVALDVSDIHSALTPATITVTIDTPPPPPPSDCDLLGLTVSYPSQPSGVPRQGGGSPPHPFIEDVLVTLTYDGTCDGLALGYDTGGSGLGLAGRVFSTAGEVLLRGVFNSGNETWTPGGHTLTATTTSVVDVGANDTKTVNLVVN